MLAPAWLRRASRSAPFVLHVSVDTSYWRTSARALGHSPHPASVTVLARVPLANPNACDSSQPLGRSATPASFQLGAPTFHDSTVVCAVSVPALLTSPPMA